MIFQSTNQCKISYKLEREMLSTAAIDVKICEISNFEGPLFIRSRKHMTYPNNANIAVTAKGTESTKYYINMDQFVLSFEDYQIALLYFEYIRVARGNIYKSIEEVHPELAL